MLQFNEFFSKKTFALLQLFASARYTPTENNSVYVQIFPEARWTEVTQWGQRAYILPNCSPKACGFLYFHGLVCFPTSFPFETSF